MDTYSINPASIIDEAVDLSMRLTGTDFPVSIFPTKIQRIISEVHECHNYPTDYIATAILTAIAVGIGNTHLAQIKQGWVESPILYIALIGRPGANKSHPLSFAMKPFLDYDYKQNQEFEKMLAKYNELMSMSRSKARSVDAKLAKATKWVGAIFVILTLVLNCMVAAGL